ncbi:MAG TPA: hypothetical protein VFU13_18605 [Steroidobacteraceae bacterium]|nr:hypothetical protein [Steroidobacteraceae bacterium]
MNRRKLMRSVLLSLLCATATALAGTPSPARVQLEGFLAAFNSGDRAKLTAFGKDHAPPDFLRPQIVDQTLEMYRASGGYDLLEVNESSPLALTSWVRARSSKEVVLLRIEVDAASPERIIVVAFQSDDPPERLRSGK